MTVSAPNTLVGNAMNPTYQRITVQGRRPFWFRIDRENDGWLWGAVVNEECDDVRIRKPFAVHIEAVKSHEMVGEWSEFTCGIPKSMVRRREAAEVSRKYGVLEIVT